MQVVQTLYREQLQTKELQLGQQLPNQVQAIEVDRVPILNLTLVEARHLGQQSPSQVQVIKVGRLIRDQVFQSRVLVEIKVQVQLAKGLKKEAGRPLFFVYSFYLRVHNFVNMAIIGKIRSKSSWIVGILGLALLAFTFDLWKDVFLGWFGKEEKSIGMIYGENVNSNDFETLKRYHDQRFELLNGRPAQGTEVDFWNDEAWTRFTDSILLDKECSELSLKVSEAEMESYFNLSMGFKGLPDIISQLKDPNPADQRNKNLQQYIIPSVFKNNQTGTYTQESIDQGKEVVQKLKNDKTERGIKLWNVFENEYKQYRLKEKYFQLISQGIFTSKLEVENNVLSNIKEKNITYLKRGFNAIQDNSINVSEEELRAYYDAHKSEEKYLNKNKVREIRYVTIPIVPSMADTALFENELSEIAVRWRNQSSDSTYIMRNSERPFYFNDARAVAVPEGSEKAEIGYQTLPKNTISRFNNVSKDSVVGPYYANGYVHISKVNGYTSSSFKLNRIFISTVGLDSLALVSKRSLVRDTIMKNINNENFAELAAKYSEDQRSKQDSGLVKIPMKNNVTSEKLIAADLLVLGMDKILAERCETIAVGSIELVEVPNGFEIVQVKDRSEDKLPLLLTISKLFSPSKGTFEDIENNAYNVLSKLQESVAKEEDETSKLKAFNTVLQQNNLYAQSLMIQNDEVNYTNAPKLYQFSESNTVNNMIELAFRNDQIGVFNDYLLMDGDNYMFAMLASIKDKGEQPFDKVKLLMEAELKKEKKAKILSADFVKSGSTLDEITTSMDSLGIFYEKNEARLSFSGANNDRIERDAKVLGAIFSGLNDGETSLPIMGSDGVYVVRINQTTESPQRTSYFEQRSKLDQEVLNGMDTRIMGALRKKADIKDNRVFVNLGINN